MVRYNDQHDNKKHSMALVEDKYYGLPITIGG
jgi:hypothetical protein